MENNHFLQPSSDIVAQDLTPLTFKQWYDRNTGFTPGQEYNLYNQYLVEWYKLRSSTVSDSKTAIKLKYLSLLKQLQLFFSSEEIENWYNKVNVENEKELLLSIPYFARKLKEIAYYYFLLRQKIKQSKIKYSLVGTELGLSQEIRENLLQNYTKNTLKIPAAIWKNVPALSSVKEDVYIHIEDLYDTFSYFDHSPTLPVSAYYNITDKNIQDFVLSKKLALSSTEWLYKLGTFNLNLTSINQNLIVFTPVNENTTDLNKDLLQKYAGNELFTSNFFGVSSKTDFFRLNINQGENLFFWPYGAYPSKIKNLPRYEAVPLSSAEFLNIGTPNDTIFVKTKRDLQGAWLQQKSTDVQGQDIEVKINANSETTFKFPFPGFGISAEDIPWTGFGFKTDIRFNYLDEDTKRAVEKEYWSTNTLLTAIQPLSIHDSTLISQGAYPSTNYNFADKIQILKTPSTYDSSNYSGPIDEVWLYRMNESCISLSRGQENKIVWPYIKVLDTTDYLETPLPFKNYNDVCNPINLTGVKILYSTGGKDIATSDVIYKINSITDTIDDAIECAWLSGNEFLYPSLNLITSQQNSLNCEFSAGNFTRFIWMGSNNFDVNRVFKYHSHYPDCLYLNKINPSYEDFESCTCKQTLFSPFGHPGLYFTEYNSHTDFIVEDNFSPAPFDLLTWKDNTNTGFAESSAFCWYKTNDTVGWNKGRWNSGATYTKNKFYLQRGKSYIYYRAGARVSKAKFPNYIVRYNYGLNPTTWMKGKYNTSFNIWEPTNIPSNMVIHPGDFLIYYKTPTQSYTLTGTTLTETPTAVRKNSVWSNYDYVTIDSYQPVAVYFPNIDYAGSDTNSQYPPPGTINKIVQYVAWRLTDPENKSTLYLNAPGFSFTPLITGLYTVQLTALTGFSFTDYSYFNNIPPITAVTSKVFVPSLTTSKVNVGNFVLRLPLQGWDYNNNTFNSTGIKDNTGAKPYWASSILDQNETVTDQYNLISQPPISRVTLNGGEYFKYSRKYSTDLIWKQPVTLLKTVNSKQWCTLQINTTSLPNQDLFESPNNAYIVQLSTPSPISLQNFVDNEPVEIIYNAENAFVWNITATPIIKISDYFNTGPNSILIPLAPWSNILNSIYPTVATYPTIESLSSSSQVGFFTPTYHGISKYINKNYTYNLNLTSEALTGVYTNPNQAIGIRGLTKEEQQTPYITNDNNVWLKEPPISSNIAGNINKDIFKKYQKFIPYQSSYETNNNLALGLILPTSRQTPWTGTNNSVWGDTQNYPASYTDVVNVSSWVSSQILKTNNLFIDNWCTDIYGNQYGLYKQYSGTSYFDQKNNYGEIWVRNNTQIVSPGYIALSSVFDTYANNTLIFADLTGNKVKKIDVFFDTLFIETSSILFLEKINYNYNTGQIFSLADDARFVSLMTPVTTNITREINNQIGSNYAIAGETWFDPSKKIVLLSVVELNQYSVKPLLYEYNLNTKILQKVFPVLQGDNFRINYQLNSLSATFVDSPTLSYNKIKKQYIYSIPVTTINNIKNIIELTLNGVNYGLHIQNIYEPKQEVLPPSINHSLIYTLTSNQTFNIQITSTPVNTVYTTTSLLSWLSLTPTGNFTGTVPFDITTYYIPFSIQNSNGTTYHNLTLNVI